MRRNGLVLTPTGIRNVILPLRALRPKPVNWHKSARIHFSNMTTRMWTMVGHCVQNSIWLPSIIFDLDQRLNLSPYKI